MPPGEHHVFLSLGSNLGDREANLRNALTRLDRSNTRLLSVSDVYETAHVGGGVPEPIPDYLNCSAAIATSLPPLALLDYTQQIERDCGRTASYRWGPRVIDIDILLYDSVSLDIGRLIIPHPRLHERAFVLVPLAELAPNLTLPDTTSVKDLVNKPEIKSQQIERWGSLGVVQSSRSR